MACLKRLWDGKHNTDRNHLEVARRRAEDDFRVELRGDSQAVAVSTDIIG